MNHESVVWAYNKTAPCYINALNAASRLGTFSPTKLKRSVNSTLNGNLMCAWMLEIGFAEKTPLRQMPAGFSELSRSQRRRWRIEHDYPSTGSPGNEYRYTPLEGFSRVRVMVDELHSQFHQQVQELTQ